MSTYILVKDKDIHSHIRIVNKDTSAEFDLGMPSPTKVLDILSRNGIYSATTLEDFKLAWYSYITEQAKNDLIKLVSFSPKAKAKKKKKLVNALDIIYGRV